MGRELSGLAARVAGARPAGWGICDEARPRVASGVDLVMLGAGIPDLATPALAVDASIAALRGGRTRYAHPQGEPRLRDLLASRHSRATGVATLPGDVLVTAGAQAAVLACLQAVVEPGSGVAVLSPYYPAYAGAVASVGARLVPVPLDARRGFALDLDALAAALTGDVRVLLLTTPHNPTGRVLTRAEADGVARLCVERDVWLVSDEVYSGLCFEGGHVSPAGLPGMAARTLTVGSLSKTHSMSGWRCGWIVAPAGLGPSILPVLASGALGIPAFVQDAAVAAIDGCAGDVAAMRAEYRHRRDVFGRALSRVRSLSVPIPEAGMFLMMDVSGTGMDGTTFAWRLLELGVCVIPGEAFGPGGGGRVRVSLLDAPDRLLLACSRMAELATGAPARSAIVNGSGLGCSGKRSASWAEDGMPGPSGS
jgi:arginine:pyruvate transaminase